MSTVVAPRYKVNKSGKKKKRKSTRSKGYVYTCGDKYPGYSFGHEECMRQAKGSPGVPPHMGWLWTHGESRKGWKPGALGQSVLKFMKLKLGTPSTIEVGEQKTRKKKVIEKQEGQHSDFPSELEDEPIRAKEALKVSKNGDTIVITLHPLKDVTTLQDGEDPFMSCDPIVFKLVQPPSTRMLMKRMAKERKKYVDEIRKSLEVALEEICQCIYEDVYCTDLYPKSNLIEKTPSFVKEPVCDCEEDVLSSSDSEWELEYTPPFAMTGLKPKKPIRVHVETQYLESDLSKRGVRMLNSGSKGSGDGSFPKITRSTKPRN